MVGLFVSMLRIVDHVTRNRSGKPETEVAPRLPGLAALAGSWGFQLSRVCAESRIRQRAPGALLQLVQQPLPRRASANTSQTGL